MTYYPVCIPTLNRHKHFKACVESLRQCTHAEKTELVVGLDYPPSEDYREGYEKIKDYLPTIDGFAKVTIFERDHNYGAVGNSRTLAKYCLEHYDAYIYTEDDNVFSPCFLDYMDKALDKYRDDERILSVSGFCHLINYGNNLESASLEYENISWGTGFWRDKINKANAVMYDKTFLHKLITKEDIIEKYLNIYPFGLRLLLNMIKYNASWGDVRQTSYNILTEHYQVQPTISLVRNIGCDGSGEHCKFESEMQMQEISTETTYNLPAKLELTHTNVPCKGWRYVNMPTDPEAYQAEIKQLRKRALKVRLLYQHPWLQWLVDRPKRLQWYAHRYWLAVLRRCGKPV